MQPRQIILSLLLPATLLISACDQAPPPEANSSMSTTEITAAEPVDVANDNAVTDQAPAISDSAPQDLAGLSATVYKDANCGCCEQWVDYADDHGMHTEVQHPINLSATKDEYAIPQSARSCHTAVTTDGYVFEGHIPAKYVAQFLENPPADAKGLAVAGMPMGSPGMEYQDKFDPYDILQINEDGSTQVYARIDEPSQQL